MPSFQCRPCRTDVSIVPNEIRDWLVQTRDRRRLEAGIQEYRGHGNSGKHLRTQVKAVIVALRLQGGRINQIAEGLHISTRTVSRTIKTNRGCHSGFFNFDHRRLPRSRNQLMKVKISGVAYALNLWLTHWDWYKTFDLDAVLRGDKPP